jgi:hypothetical protein
MVCTMLVNVKYLKQDAEWELLENEFGFYRQGHLGPMEMIFFI